MKASATFDWKQISYMSDEEVYQKALDDPDNPPLMYKEMANAIRSIDMTGPKIAEKYENLWKIKLQ